MCCLPVCLQPIILDARGHLLGRLAAIVAKTTLQGEFVCDVVSAGLSFLYFDIGQVQFQRVTVKRELNRDKKWQSDDLFYIIMNEIHCRFNQFCVILKLS